MKPAKIRTGLLIVILNRHQDRLGSLPVLSFQSPLAYPISPVILLALDLGTFGIITFEDGGTFGIFELGIGFEFILKLFVRNL